LRAWVDGGDTQPIHLPLGRLKVEIMKVTQGRKIAYVVDVAFSEPNAEAIVALVSNADMLFIDASFLDEEAARAAARSHLTARQAVLLARRANIKHLSAFHYSPRYQRTRRESRHRSEAGNDANR
jgi:ribonuclease Z